MSKCGNRIKIYAYIINISVPHEVKNQRVLLVKRASQNEILTIQYIIIQNEKWY